MIDEFIENIEAYLLLNQLGDMSGKLTIDYIKMSLDVYKKQVTDYEAKIQEGRQVSPNRAYTKS